MSGDRVRRSTARVRDAPRGGPRLRSRGARGRRLRWRRGLAAPAMRAAALGCQEGNSPTLETRRRRDVRCPRCRQENRPGAKFCEECGAALARACDNCGTELSPTAKFCSECGFTPTFVLMIFCSAVIALASFLPLPGKVVDTERYPGTAVRLSPSFRPSGV
jgi:Double zinc ribbon